MADPLQEVYALLRGLAAYGTIAAVDDTGQAQRVSATSADGVNRADVEVHQAFGFASCPPAQGGICVLIAVGADPANLVALPLAAPAQRLGNLQPGEAAIYGSDGSRVHIKTGGVIEIWGGTSVTINAPAVTINAPNGVTVNGTLTVSDDVIVDGMSVKNHNHSDPQGGDTGAMQN